MTEGGGRYTVVYADPPWSHDQWTHGNRRPSLHYPVMSLADIKALPVGAIARKDAFLFLWTTGPHLPEAYEVISAWGFRYVTVGFTWVKRNKKVDSLFWGCGSYTRANAEYCLLGKRGTPKVVSRSVHSVVYTPIQRHSEKPAEVRQRIVALVGDVPRIELFARERVDGWDAWGNQVRSDIALGEGGER